MHKQFSKLYIETNLYSNYCFLFISPLNLMTYVELSWKITWGQFPFVWKTIKWLFFLLLSLHFLLLEVSEGTCFCFYVTTFKNICLVFEFSNLVFISFLFQCLFPDLDIFFNVAILNKIVAEFPPATTTGPVEYLGILGSCSQNGDLFLVTWKTARFI